MDEFLKNVGMNHIANSGEFKEILPEMENFEKMLKKYVSENLYDELVEILNDAIIETNEYAFVEGMKTAIAITEKKYKLVI